MEKRKESKTVIVTGDVTIDWNIARLQRQEGMTQGWNAEDLTAAFCQRGGAAMLGELVAAVAGSLDRERQARITVHQVSLPAQDISPTDPHFPHSCAMWRPFNRDERSGKKVWRVDEFLGLKPAYEVARPADARKTLTANSINPSLIVISDANLGFRRNPELWPSAIKSKATQPWILVNTARPVAQGDLWDQLYKNHCDRLIAVMTANDLRSEQVQISRGLSWERTAQDLLWEIQHNPHVNRLAQCAYVIVSFGTAGVLLYSRKTRLEPAATLFFDPSALEGEWGRRYAGWVIGYTSCLIGGLARELMLDNTNPDIGRGIQAGIGAMRFLHIEGYGQVNSDPKEIQLSFPSEEIAANLAEGGEAVATANVTNPARAAVTTKAKEKRFWSILEDKYPKSLDSVAERIAREGLETALPDVPIDRFGNLKTVDRREIEALHSISSLIREYARSRQQKPFSIAVFGPPGSGKSFSVTQVAKSVLPGEIADKPLNFNLSQLNSPEDLFDALHQVRDVALSGRLPLVFWDEFDSHLQNQPLGWLRYFLMPMQDGEFQEGQIKHPIGRCIFVFAGGTSPNMESFGSNMGEKEQAEVKLPDFVSRLKGYLNILGPNPQGSKKGTGSDPYYIMRRAITLRSIFERSAPHLFYNEGNKRNIMSIDRGVLNAFLLTKEYRHGARSMEAIVTMSQLAGKTSFERSSLPSEAQLDLHVDGHDFFAIIQRMEINDEIIERLAEATHEIFRADMKAKGYVYGPVTDDRKKRHSSLCPYSELPEEEKEQNRGNVRDIQNKLTSVGYEIVPARGNQNPARFTKAEIEKLAIEEHERWMKQKKAEGWKKTKNPTDSKDTVNKLHPAIVKWEELPENEREKDRAQVKGIPRILRMAGYIMVKKDSKNSRKNKRGK
ncbi:MAG: hypothetical protein A2Y89_03750 [Chloroflexi bacterium RBG_13_51_18]|nr:MAG: hypothetical protein A2Y89_03750 [Chloroflexi bacterium RBG_13_51_18]